MTLWLIRAGRYGEREDFALENKLAVIGWDNLPDLSRIENREELAEILAEKYPDEKAKNSNELGKSNMAFYKWDGKRRFSCNAIKASAIIVFGKVEGDYRYEPNNPSGFRHTRPVKWDKEIPRNQIDQDLLYSFGAAMTVCTIHRNNAEKRIQALLSGKPIQPSEFIEKK